MKREKHFFKHRKQQGYTLMTTMIIVSSLMLLSISQFQKDAFELQVDKARNAGKHILELNNAVEAYLVFHGPQLRAMLDNDCFGNATCTAAVTYCTPIGVTGNQCELDLTRLVAENLLPPNWINENPWRSAYRTVITRVPKINAPTTPGQGDYNLRAITVTQTPWMDASNTVAQLGFLGMAVKAGGADVAMSVGNATQISGLVRRTYNADLSMGGFVTWVGDNTMHPGINAVGLLAARAGFESASANALNTLMKTDGSRAMTGDLLMANHELNGVRDAYIRGTGTSGRNLASALPTWVYKYTWRISDGQSVPKPDCSAASGGWTNPTTLTNPWDPTYTANASNAAKNHDRGEARILVTADNLKDLRSLGYDDTDAITAPANDPYVATASKARARGAYTFYAQDNPSSWTVFFRYWQNNTYNTATDATAGQGLAAVYCYYDNKAESACADNGTCGSVAAAVTGTAASGADLTAPVNATSAVPEQALTASSTLSGTIGGPTGGAADQIVNPTPP